MITWAHRSFKLVWWSFIVKFYQCHSVYVAQYSSMCRFLFVNQLINLFSNEARLFYIINLSCGSHIWYLYTCLSVSRKRREVWLEYVQTKRGKQTWTSKKLFDVLTPTVRCFHARLWSFMLVVLGHVPLRVETVIHWVVRSYFFLIYRLP